MSRNEQIEKLVVEMNTFFGIKIPFQSDTVDLVLKEFKRLKYIEHIVEVNKLSRSRSWEMLADGITYMLDKTGVKYVPQNVPVDSDSWADRADWVICTVSDMAKRVEYSSPEVVDVLSKKLEIERATTKQLQSEIESLRADLVEFRLKGFCVEDIKDLDEVLK